MQQQIGIIGTCQLHLCSEFFLNDEIKQKYNINVKFNLSDYMYDPSYFEYKGSILDYNIFDDLDILIISMNLYTNEVSSEKIINYLKSKNIKIIKVFLIKFPIYPLNWSGFGMNRKDLLNWNGLDNIDYKCKFKECIKSMYKSNENSDLSIEITKYVEKFFDKQYLFLSSLHPTNKLLYVLWKYILQHLSINIENHKYIFSNELLPGDTNPFTSKMIKDLDIQIENANINDKFYINKYNESVE